MKNTYSEAIKKRLLEYLEFPNIYVDTDKTANEIEECQRRKMPVAVAVEHIVWGVHTLTNAEEFCRKHGWKPDEQFFLDKKERQERWKKYELK